MADELSAELSEHVNTVQLPVVLVTHDVALARALGRELILLRAGRVGRVGSAREILVEPH